MPLWVSYLQGHVGNQEQRWGQCPGLWDISFNYTKPVFTQFYDSWPMGGVHKLQFTPQQYTVHLQCHCRILATMNLSLAVQVHDHVVKYQLTGKGGRGGVSICSEVNWQQLQSCGFRIVLLPGFDSVCITDKKLFPLIVSWLQFVETSDHGDLSPLFCPQSCSNQCFLICQELAGSAILVMWRGWHFNSAQCECEFEMKLWFCSKYCDLF